MTQTRSSSFFQRGDCADSRYRKFRDHPVRCAFIERLWSCYQPCAERDFRKQAKEQFHQRYWEMYLGVALLQRGIQLQRIAKKKGEGGPDLCFISGNRKVWVEAVAPMPGTGEDRVPDVLPPRFPNDKILFRFTNALDEKRKQYASWLSKGIVSQSHLFMFAINSHLIPGAPEGHSLPYFVMALLPFGDLTVLFDKRTLQVTDRFHQRRESITKANRRAVATNSFLDPQFAFVSAVLHSGAPWEDGPAVLDADFCVLHNPLAPPSNRLDPAVFSWCEQRSYHDGRLETVSATASSQL